MAEGLESESRVVSLQGCSATGDLVPTLAEQVKSNELKRLYRDVRCGGFHPANTLAVSEIVGKTVLGIDLPKPPRWGGRQSLLERKVRPCRSTWTFITRSMA